MDNMKVLQICALGDEEAIMAGIREFPITKMVLMNYPGEEDRARRIMGQLAPLKIDIDRHSMGENILMSTLQVVTEIVTNEGKHYDEILVNAASGDKLASCALLSAAFVNGRKAFGVMDDKIMMMPVLKFSYTELISEPKLNLLKALQEAGDEVDSLNSLAKLSGIDKSLLSYHIRGGRDSKGLEELGLVSVDRQAQGKLNIQITELGKLMMVGREN